MFSSTVHGPRQYQLNRWMNRRRRIPFVQIWFFGSTPDVKNSTRCVGVGRWPQKRYRRVPRLRRHPRASSSVSRRIRSYVNCRTSTKQRGDIYYIQMGMNNAAPGPGRRKRSLEDAGSGSNRIIEDGPRQDIQSIEMPD